MHVRTIVSEKACGNVLGVWRPLNAQYLVVMSSVGTVKIKGSKFSDEMIWRVPDLDVRVVGSRDVPKDTPSSDEGTHHCGISTLTFHLERT